MNRQIIFPEAERAEMVEIPLREPGPREVTVRTLVSTVSPGTERANLSGDPNVSPASCDPVPFPRSSGYSSSGIVETVGSAVTSLVPGDRVAVYWGKHAAYNVVPEEQAVKIPFDDIGAEEAAAVFISTFPLAALRKTHHEIGEGVLVMGLGLLGQFAVRLARAAGACPVIAVDPVASRREDAVKGGADFAFDPFAPDFVSRVKEVSGGGVPVAIEVTGQGAGLDGALDCMAKFGRVALLGCTRNSDFNIDFYRKVHYPGITLVGAHTCARPDGASYPGMFTHRDDMLSVMKLLHGGRLDFAGMVGHLHSPAEYREVYDRLLHDRNFPMLTQFDWRRL